MVFLFGIGLIIHYLGKPNLRLLWLMLVVAGGMLFKVSLSVQWVQELLRFHLPPVSNLHMFLLTLLVLVTTPLLGPLWCAHLCPFGALQELISRLGMTLGLTREPPQRVSRVFKGLRYLALLVVVLSLYSSNPSSLDSVDPMSTTLASALFGTALVVSLLSMFGALFEFRFYCRNLCPVGALLSVLGKLSLLFAFKPRRDYSACDLGVQGPWDTNCMQCNRCITELSRPSEERPESSSSTGS